MPAESGRDPTGPEDLVLVVASGLAVEVADVAAALGHRVLGYLDDDPQLRGAHVRERLAVLGRLDAVPRHSRTQVLLCAEAGADRRLTAERLAGVGLRDERYATVIASDVTVPPSCRIGAGSIVLNGGVLAAEAVMGRHVVLLAQVVVGRDARIDDFATVGAGAVLGAAVRIGRGADIGMAATVKDSLVVGENATLGVGSVLLEDLPPGEFWTGTPARPARTPGA